MSCRCIVKLNVFARVSEESHYLFGEYVICVYGHGGSVRDKVRDWFHNVPRVFPPSETCQYAKLHRHEAQADPSEHRRLSAGHQVDRLPFLRTKKKLNKQTLICCSSGFQCKRRFSAQNSVVKIGFIFFFCENRSRILC